VRIEQQGPWLSATFEQPQRCLSWAVHRPGFVVAERVLWRQVRNEDLHPQLDAVAWLAAELQARGDAAAIGLLTSRTVACFETARARVAGVECEVLLTLGLSNAVRAAAPRAPAAWQAGTINLLAQLSQPLSDTALIEAVSIASEARTAALLDEPWEGIDGDGPITGTGTDCVVIAAAPGEGERYAGLHTAVGQALAQAVYAATRRAARRWLDEFAAAFAARG